MIAILKDHAIHTSIIAGLGNPGIAYEGSRHNIGFDVLDAFADQYTTLWQKNNRLRVHFCKINYNGSNIVLIKPQSFMNLSGQCLMQFFRFYKTLPSALIVVQDDINIDTGKFKSEKAKKSGGHNGVANVIHHFGMNFTRFRIGIGNKSIQETGLTQHVLGKFPEYERNILETSMAQFIEGLKLLVDKEADDAKNPINKTIR